jgi:hypothetical protein
MLQMLGQIGLALVVTAVFNMNAWALGNGTINRLSSPIAAVTFQEQDYVPINQLPNPVTTAIKNRFPKGELLSAEKDLERGMVKYEVKVRSEGKIYNIDVTPAGKILKIDLEDD